MRSGREHPGDRGGRLTGDSAPRILLRYHYPDDRLQAALPMRVMEEREDVVVAWLAAGTEIMYWATDAGADPRTIPLAERFGVRLTTAPRTWEGTGVLRVIPLHRAWSVIHFWDGDGGSFAAWYVNLESPKTRRGDVIETVDWHLDLVIHPDLSTTWKDEDEADAALGTPYLGEEDLARAREVGRSIEREPRAFVEALGDWTGFTAPEGWGPLSLPSGWDAD